MALFPDLTPKPRRRMTTLNSKEKAIIIGDIEAAMAKKHFQPMDLGAKNIIASQIGSLLKGGYGFSLIRDTALTIALTEDPNDPFRFTRLHAKVLTRASEEDYKRHDQAKREGGAPMEDPGVAALVGAAVKRKRGEKHPFMPRFDDPRRCGRCDNGPRKAVHA